MRARTPTDRLPQKKIPPARPPLLDSRTGASQELPTPAPHSHARPATGPKTPNNTQHLRGRPDKQAAEAQDPHRLLSACKSLRLDAADAYELDSCDEMRRAPSEAHCAPQTDLLARLKEKVRSQALRLLDLETKTPPRSSSAQDPPSPSGAHEQLLEENARLRSELSEMKQELLELQRQVAREQEEASCKLQELHELLNDLQAVLKQECYKNEKLEAYADMLSRLAEDRLADAKPGAASSKPELHGAVRKMKQVFEENCSLRSANHKLTGEMTDSLEHFKQRSQELKSQLQEHLGKRSKADEQLVAAEAKLQESQSEVRRAQQASRLARLVKKLEGEALIAGKKCDSLSKRNASLLQTHAQLKAVLDLLVEGARSVASGLS